MVNILNEIENFFLNGIGRVIYISSLTRLNHQRRNPPGDCRLICITVHIIVNNKIFDNGNNFLLDIFPKYRFLCNLLTEYLNKKGFEVNSLNSNISISIIPYPNPLLKNKIIKNKLDRPSKGKFIFPIDEIAKTNRYYKGISKKYRIEFGVLSSNDTIIGPDLGIIETSHLVAETFPTKIKVVEIGSGAGSTPLSLLPLGKISYYFGNDYSPEMEKFFFETVHPKLLNSGISVKYVNCHCINLDIPIKADLFILGVYYEAQLDFIKKNGHGIVKSLGNSGVLIIQSGKPENAFITQLLYGENSNQKYWPWFKDEYKIINYFKYISEFIVCDETMLICTNNFVKFIDILKRMNKCHKLVNFNIY